MRLTPRAGQDRVEGWITDPARPDQKLLKIRVAAPPVDGAANTALVRLLAKALSIPRSSIDLVSGQTAQIKTIRISEDPAILKRFS